MKAWSIIKHIVRLLGYTVLAVVLLLCGVVALLYSDWAQDKARRAVVAKLSTPAADLSLDFFRLDFPLEIEAGGLVLTSYGDTMMAASSLRAEIDVLPLLAGKAVISGAEVSGVRYRMGVPDSALFLNIAADSIALAPASVKLADMAIKVGDGLIRGGRLTMVMNTDTAPPTPPAPPTRMSIALDRIALDDFTYTMRMMPTIDTLSAHIAASELRDGLVDLFNQKIDLASFKGRGLSARYIVPDSATLAASGPYPLAASSDTVTSAPWTVAIDSIDFHGGDALYATAGVTPLPGLDFTYISLDSIDLALHDFYNQATTVRLPLKLHGRERCGVVLDVDGTLDIDSAALNFRQVHLATPRGTDVRFDGLMGMGDMVSDPSLPLGINLDGAFAPGDMADMFPAFTPYLAAIPAADDILLTLGASGTTGNLVIDNARLLLNNCVTLNASGNVENMMNLVALGGNIKLRGNIINVNSFKNKLLAKETAAMLRIPPMTLDGNVAMKRGVVDGRLTAVTKGGRIGLDARWNGDAEAYRADVTASTFPVQAFMPLLGVEQVTAKAHVTGRGYDPFVKSTKIDADIDVAKAVYDGVAYTDIKAKAGLDNGHATVSLKSANPSAEFSLLADGNLDGNVYNWNASLNGSYIDLYALKFMQEPASLEIALEGNAVIGPGKNDIQAVVNVSDVFFRRAEGTIALNDINARFDAADSLTYLTVKNRDLDASFRSPAALDSLMSSFTAFSDLLGKQLAVYTLDADTLCSTLPPFALDMHGGRSNLVNDILAPSKMSVRSFDFRVANDSTLVINGSVERFDTGSMLLDSIFIGGGEHRGHFHLDAGVRNRPGNLDQWHRVDLKTVIQGKYAHVGLKQQNLKGVTGYEIGLAAQSDAADSTLTLHVRPYSPIIAYQSWSANPDNFISYNIPTGHIDANLRMKGGNSALAIYTEHPDSTTHRSHSQEDLELQLTDIHLSDWIAVNPFAPPIKGDVNADMRLNRHDGLLVGQGSAGITNFVYGKQRVADFKTNFNIAATPSGTIRADADVLVDGVKTMTLSGALNDSTAISPLALDFSMIRFPLATVNPFLPGNVARMSGMLNGSLKISGTQDAPIFNGTLDFDSTAVRLGMTGTEYKFSPTPIKVVDGLVSFDNFSIKGCNDNPLNVNGTVDISSLDNMKFNLALKADNMMIVNSNRLQKGADIFGKGYISLNATARGSMSFMMVNADLSVNSGTNITYVIPGATTTLANRSVGDMVKFVNFTDSAAVVAADSLVQSGMAMMLDANLTLQDGNIINVYLSPDGKNRAQVESNGQLTFEMTPLDNGRLSGRINLDKGFVRYSPPFMSEKLFNFERGSYVAFNGDMMNPTLNIHANDVVKANVTQTGQNSRLVNFDIGLSVTGTLNQMDVAFDLSTNDDITVANELESMTPQQRANQAMNMLLYNVYTGPGTKGDASLAGNPLFSFLESQVNSWAANNIKGVDISFGIDQYDRTIDGNTSQTMSYSYQVSKSLFNDRFKIVVGGNYSTDANADENFSQNLINDISFEYFLNAQRTMYVRLFRHTGYESILEGEITQTGVGFVYRRKLRRLGDMFLTPKAVERRIQRENLKNETVDETH